MTVSRRIAAFLLAVAAWNVYIWLAFARNLSADDGRSTGFYVVHALLIVVNLLIAAVLGVLGWRMWRAAPRGVPEVEPAGSR
ncbi:MAG: hypothetical protein M3P91_01185 [Actinomycetota bacterium]|nr:hypothetical protein [Actinomycetota bacterium]